MNPQQSFHIPSRIDWAGGAYPWINLKNIELYTGAAANPADWVPGNTGSLAGVSLVLQSRDGSGTDNQQGFTFTKTDGPYVVTAGTSARFDGSGDYLSLADSSDWAFGTDPFTIDFWMYPQSVAGGALLCFGDANIDNSILMRIVTGLIDLRFGDASHNWAFIGTSTNLVVANVWSHVAVVRNGSSVKLYINGAHFPMNSESYSGAIYDASTPVFIGAQHSYGSPSGYFTGYIDELRISKGNARWTADFTPPDAPYGGVCAPNPTVTPTRTATATPTLTPTVTLSPTLSPTLTPTLSPTLTPTESPTLTPTPEPTKTPQPTETPTLEPTATATPLPCVGNDLFTVLLLQSEEADGSTQFADTSAGHTEPHPVTAVGDVHHDTSQARFGDSSIAVDGNGDYLTIPASIDWGFGTGPFTVECWFRGTPPAVNYVTVVGRTSGTGGGWADINWVIALQSNSKVMAQVSNNGGASGSVTLYSTANVGDNQWHHLALTRNGNRFDLFVDGVMEANATSTLTVLHNQRPVRVGWGYAPSEYLTGSVEEVRISKGIARWTANFTPPSQPYAPCSYPPVGCALQFDNSDDYAVIPHSSSLGQTAALSVSFWLRGDPNDTSVSAILDKSHNSGGSVNGWAFQVNHQEPGQLRFVYGSQTGAWRETHSTSNVNDGVWHHITGTIDGAVQAIYVDGALESQQPNGGAIQNNSQPLYFGRYWGNIQYYSGQLDDVAVYDRALTANEVQAIYDDGLLGIGVVPDGSTGGLWRLDEGSGTAIADSSGNGNHGALSGPAWICPGGFPTPTPAATATLTPTQSPTLTPTESPTLTPTPEPTKTPELTATPTANPTATPQPSATPTIEPTATALPCVHSGDANGDGQITPGDAQRTFYFYLSCAEQNPTRDEYCAADFCGSGEIEPCDNSVTPADAQGIMRFYLGYPEPCGKRISNSSNSASSSLAIELGQDDEARITVADVVISGSQVPISAFGFQVRFDPAKFTFDRALPGALDPGWAMFGARESAPGLVTAGGFSLDSLAPGSAGTLARLVFVRSGNQQHRGEPLMQLGRLDDDLANAAAPGNGTELSAAPK